MDKLAQRGPCIGINQNQNPDLNKDVLIKDHVLDNADPTTLEERNVAFIDTAPPVTMGSTGGFNGFKAHSETILSYLKRPVLLNTFEWSSTAARGAQLYRFDLVRDWISASPYLIGKMLGFSLLRTDFEVEFRINSTRFMYGNLVMAWRPLDGAGPDVGINWVSRDNVWSDTLNPSVLISATQATTTVLQVPYVHPYRFLPIAGTTGSRAPSTLGSINIRVLNPLQASSSSGTIIATCSVFVRALNPILTGFTVEPVIPDTVVELQSLVLGDMSQGVVGGVMSSSNNAELVGAGTVEQVMSRWNFIATVGWSPTTVPETPIYRAKVFPRLASNGDSLATTPAGNFRNYMTHLGDAFEYWRGSIDFCVQVVCSAFHTGRLQISWTPDYATLASSRTLTQLGNAGVDVLDVATEACVIVRVPFITATSWLTLNQFNGVLRVVVLNNLGIIGTVNQPVDVNIWMRAGPDFQFALPRGMLMTDVTAFEPAGVTTGNYALRSLGRWPRLPPQAYLELPGPLDGGEVDEEPDPVVELQCLNLPDTETKILGVPGEMHMEPGISPVTFMDAIKTYSPARAARQISTTFSIGVNVLLPRDPTGGVVSPIYLGNYIRYFGCMYTGARGGVWYKSYGPNGRMIGGFIDVQDNVDGDSSPYFGAAVTTSEATGAGGLLLPYTGMTTFVPRVFNAPTYGNTAAGNPFFYRMAVNTGGYTPPTGTITTPMAIVFAKAADDFSFVQLMAPVPRTGSVQPTPVLMGDAINATSVNYNARTVAP